MADDHNSSTVRKSQSLRVVKLGASVVPPPDQSNDTAAIKSNAVEKEDEYAQFYVGAQQDAGLIPPPFSPRLLRERVQSNNALSPCIEAMVTNIDGTGYDFENETETKDDDEDDTKIDELREFFAQPWPGMSWTTMRKLLRRDLEELGNAYLEVLRNPADEICFLKYIDGKMMRLVKLDEPAPVEQTVFRKGKKVTLTVATRERRFCQMMNCLSLVYFKEFGSKRDLDKTKGTWATKGQRLAAKDRATEVLHFSGLPDANTPYGLPRWWHQTPSVLGSRKAEEFNLEFFDNGGVPPVMIFLQGGTLAPESRQAIEAKTSGPAAKNNRVQVIEVDPSGGSLESTPQARVTVERFGAERQQDSMFEKYDERCETRVRRAFRLPPIFIGAAQDYSFACYDAQTETLTDRGWVTYDKFQPGMRIACYDPVKRALEYHAPNGGALVYDVKNIEMHRFSGESLNMLITPKHRMHWETQYGLAKTAPIEEMLATCSRPSFVARIDQYTEGDYVPEFSPPWVPLRGGANIVYDRAPWPLPIDDFLEFAGWFLSEGTALQQGSALSICQKATRHWPRIEALFRRLENKGYGVWWPAGGANDMRQAILADNSMYYWFREQSGFKGHEKRIPTFIKALCKDQLAIFFDALMAGDGTVDKRSDRKSGAYSTVSKALADDVQEIAIKLGYRTKLRQEPAGTEGVRPVYRVLLSKGARAGGDGRTQSVRYEEQHSRELYTGKVYCFSVPTGVFVTRRNGVVAIQGNTAFASYTVAEAQVFKPERDEFDAIITMRLLPAMGYDGYKQRSKPLVIEDATLKLQGIEIAVGTQQVDMQDVVEAINEVVGTHLKITDKAPTPIPNGSTHTIDGQGNIVPIADHPAFAAVGAKGPSANGSASGLSKPTPPAIGAAAKAKPVGTTATARKSDGRSVERLALDTLVALRKRDIPALADQLMVMASLDEAGRAAFDAQLAEMSFVDPTLDPDGLRELSACTLQVMAGLHDHAH